MLAFLSRDPRNAKRVVQIQQDAQASLVVKKAKKCLTEEKKGKTQPTLVFPPVSLEIGWKLVEIGGLESVRICETFRLAEIDVLINADETFLRFYPEEEHVIAPEGSKRVGSTNETLKEDCIYNSLVKNQQACELTF